MSIFTGIAASVLLLLAISFLCLLAIGLYVEEIDEDNQDE